MVMGVYELRFQTVRVPIKKISRERDVENTYDEVDSPNENYYHIYPVGFSRTYIVFVLAKYKTSRRDGSGSSGRE